jgi:hypothetical protein
VGAALHGLVQAGDVDLRVGTRRTGPVWNRADTPTLLLSLRWRDPHRTHLEERIEKTLAAKPRRGHALFWRVIHVDEDGSGFERDAQDEVVAAGLARGERVDKHRIRVIWDERRVAALEPEYEERCGPWLDYCLAHPDVVAALAADVPLSWRLGSSGIGGGGTS